MPSLALPAVTSGTRPLGGLLRRHSTAIVGGALLSLMIAMAVLAPFLGTVSPEAVSPIARLRPPSQAFWFGTDMVGRDIWSRTVYGGRISLTIGLAVALLSSTIGLLIGATAGFLRRVDAVIMRVMDGLMSIPSIMLAIALITLHKASMTNVIIAISVVETPRVVRLVRGIALSLREQPYVEAAIAMGTSTPRILVLHILPNTLAPLLVQATYICGGAMIYEALLSFIGAGTPPSIPSWGNVMAEGRSYFEIAWWIIVFPGAFLSLTVLAINLLGDGIRDALDPRFVRQM